MDKLIVERDKVLEELKRKCNTEFGRMNLKSRLIIIMKNGEKNFRLDTDPKEFSFAYAVLKEEMDKLGLGEIRAEMDKKS